MKIPGTLKECVKDPYVSERLKTDKLVASVKANHLFLVHAKILDAEAGKSTEAGRFIRENDPTIWDRLNGNQITAIIKAVNADNSAPPESKNDKIKDFIKEVKDNRLPAQRIKELYQKPAQSLEVAKEDTPFNDTDTYIPVPVSVFLDRSVSDGFAENVTERAQSVVSASSGSSSQPVWPTLAEIAAGLANPVAEGTSSGAGLRSDVFLNSSEIAAAPANPVGRETPLFGLDYSDETVSYDCRPEIVPAPANPGGGGTSLFGLYMPDATILPDSSGLTFPPSADPSVNTDQDTSSFRGFTRVIEGQAATPTVMTNINNPLFRENSLREITAAEVEPVHLSLSGVRTGANSPPSNSEITLALALGSEPVMMEPGSPVKGLSSTSSLDNQPADTVMNFPLPEINTQRVSPVSSFGIQASNEASRLVPLEIQAPAPERNSRQSGREAFLTLARRLFGRRRNA